jgi:aspartyl-tRNA(Asn)/glutamyl-tRNA(Gln) amidotransferase subunit A
MYLGDIYTVSANLTGIPAISVPLIENNSLPIGLQFMAPHFKEEKLLDVAEQILI